MAAVSKILKKETKIKFFSILLILVLLLVSCGEEKSEKENKNDFDISYNKIINYELDKEKQYYDVFLDFKFGMSQDQVERKFDILIAEGKVFQDSTMKVSYLDSNITVFGYMYDFHSDSTIYKSIINNMYYNDSLYVQTLVIYSGYNLSSYENLVELYEKKYGDYKLQREGLYAEGKTIWINSNREIIIAKLSGIGISIKYTDLKIRNSKYSGQSNKTKFDHKENLKKTEITESDI